MRGSQQHLEGINQTQRACSSVHRTPATSLVHVNAQNLQDREENVFLGLLELIPVTSENSEAMRNWLT